MPYKKGKKVHARHEVKKRVYPFIFLGALSCTVGKNGKVPNGERQRVHEGHERRAQILTGTQHGLYGPDHGLAEGDKTNGSERSQGSDECICLIEGCD